MRGEEEMDLRRAPSRCVVDLVRQFRVEFGSAPNVHRRVRLFRMCGCTATPCIHH